MRYDLNISFSSPEQAAVFRQAMSGDVRTLLVRGGSGSGKTYVLMLAVLKRAMKYPGTEHYLLKTDLKVLKAGFDKNVIGFLKKSKIPASRTKKANTTYFYDEARSELYLANGSVIYLRPIRSPYPSNAKGDAAILGLNAETIMLDESTTIAYAWYQFLETRARSAHGCPPLIAMSENPDARSWTSLYFDQEIDPATMSALTPIQKAESKVMRIEAWNNVLQDKKYLEMLKNSGNALRFYYGQIDLSPDYGQIYQYDVEAFPFRMYNIYALDPGYQAQAAIVQLGFGGDLTVNVRELCYAQGYGHDDYMREVQKIIDQHAAYYERIQASLKPGQELWLAPIQRVPHIIVDCARTDLIADIDRYFNYRIVGNQRFPDVKVVLIPSRKGEAKYYSIERVKKLRQKVDPNSKNYLKEIGQYRYDVSKTDDEKVPDGNDNLLDAALYGMRYILEDTFANQRSAMTFDLLRQQIFDQIKHITP